MILSINYAYTLKVYVKAKNFIFSFRYSGKRLDPLLLSISPLGQSLTPSICPGDHYHWDRKWEQIQNVRVTCHHSKKWGKNFQWGGMFEHNWLSWEFPLPWRDFHYFLLLLQDRKRKGNFQSGAQTIKNEPKEVSTILYAIQK